MIVAFEVNAPPAVQGNHRVTERGQIYEASSRRLRDWREAIGWAAKAAMRREQPLAGPLRVKLSFTLHAPKAGAKPYPSARPDLDKLTRAVFDAMTGIAYADDGQIVEMFVTKRWGTPGVRVEVIELIAKPCPVCGNHLVDDLASSDLFCPSCGAHVRQPLELVPREAG